MKDCNGFELEIGDRVAVGFAGRGSGGVGLATVVKFSPKRISVHCDGEFFHDPNYRWATTDRPLIRQKHVKMVCFISRPNKEKSYETDAI